MKNLFISFALLLGLLFAGIAATTPTQTLPISQMPITTNISSNAYFPLIQPYPGRTTNDNFRATRATLLRGVDTITATNIYVTNLYASNLFVTNFFALQTNNYFTNIYVETAIITNLFVTNGPIQINGSNVAIINPTDNYIPYRVNTNTFGDSSLQVTGGSVVEGATFGAINIQATNELSTKGAFMTKSVSSVTLAGGTNVVTTVNKGLIFIANLTGNTNKVVQLSSGNGIGQHVWIVNADTNQWFMPQEALSDDSSKTNFIRGGVWAPSELGETIELMEIANGWVEIGRSNPNGGPPVVVNSELWTNSAGLLRPSDLSLPVAANEINASNILSTDGAFLTRALSTATLSPGTNVLVLANKAMLVLASLDTNGVVVNLTSGNGSGQHVWLLNYWTNASFTLPSGVCFDDTNKVVEIRGGSWVPTEAGETIELLGVPNGWVEINRSNPNGLPPTADDHLVFASGLDTVPGTLIDKTLPGVGIVLSVEGDTDDHLTIGLEPSMILWTNNAGILQPTDLTLPLYWTNVVTLGVEDSPAINFGPGDSNILYRASAAMGYNQLLTYKSGGGAQYSVIGLESTDGFSAVITGYRNGSYGLLQLVGKDEVQMGTLADNVHISAGVFQPNNGGTIDIGSPTIHFKNAYLSNSVTVVGFYDNTNYAQAAWTHSGTNGSVIFDSQASGTAGAARDFLFQSNGVTVAKIAANSGYAGGGTLFLSDDGTYKAAGGGGGTTINPTDGYLPYRANSTTFADSPIAVVGATNVTFAGVATFGTNGEILAITNALAYSGTALISTSSINLQSGGNTGIGFYPNGNFTWNFDVDGHLNPAAGATYNIGVQADGTVVGAKAIAAATFVLSSSHTPANSSETNYAGALAYDANFLYVWTATNVNKRISLSTW